MEIYSKFNLADLDKNLTDGLDAIICSTSFEARCLSIPLNVNPNHIERAIIVSKDAAFPHVKKNKEKLLEHFADKTILISGHNDNILLIADNIRSSLQMIKNVKPGKFLIDITTFTHEILLVLFRIIHQTLDEKDKIYIAYNPSKDYSGGVALEDRWLSKGIGEIRSVLGYPGNFKPSRKSHLIVLLGYETERAELLIDAYEPASISLGLGAKSESVSPTLYDINVQFHDKLKHKLRQVDEFNFSCINPVNAKKSILQQVDKYIDNNIVIAPMNTKVSTLGAALAAIECQNIQICYASALQYNYDNYSIPSDECYFFDLPEIF